MDTKTFETVLSIRVLIRIKGRTREYYLVTDGGRKSIADMDRARKKKEADEKAAARLLKETPTPPVIDDDDDDMPISTLSIISDTGNTKESRKCLVCNGDTFHVRPGFILECVHCHTRFQIELGRP